LDRTIADYDGARLTRTEYAFQPHFDDRSRLDRAVADALAHVGEGADHFEQVLAAHGINDPQLVEEARGRFMEDLYRGLHLFDETLDVVAAVAEVAAVGLVTNGPTAIQRPKIDLLELEPLFPVIVISEEAGVWKPDPRIFEIALERSGIAASDAIYVGDSAEHDIPGAHAAGLRAVWVNRLGIDWPGARPPDAEIRDLYQLLPLLGIDHTPMMESN
ncbi:MAG TPA: HAD family hydrolase, partial [Thermomicrobiales bacterium]|nr:HAD family hydrolase [Thermomicrobiales bacterium]